LDDGFGRVVVGMVVVPLANGRPDVAVVDSPLVLEIGFLMRHVLVVGPSVVATVGVENARPFSFLLPNDDDPSVDQMRQID
jgi:hypothetical protein